MHHKFHLFKVSLNNTTYFYYTRDELVKFLNNRVTDYANVRIEMEVLEDVGEVVEKLCSTKTEEEKTIFFEKLLSPALSSS